MLLDTRRAVARMLPRAPMHIASAVIVPDGGRANIAAKVLATLWYLLILPDSHSRFVRQLNRKRVPWYSPSRIVGLCVSAANMVAMPASWALLIAGRRNAARVASFGVLANPPSITLSLLLAQELGSQLVKLTSNFVSATGSLLARPVFMIMPPSTDSQADQQQQNTTENSSATPAVTTATSEPVAPASAPSATGTEPAPKA